MVRHRARADPDVGKGLHLVELSLRGLDRRRPRPPARPHLGLARAEGPGQRLQDHPRRPQLGAAVGSCAGDGRDGGLDGSVAACFTSPLPLWERPDRMKRSVM
ncbi:hypothetical protein chiPu_0029838 [Chiloscyllium punctatum]|uniref:Uncharacterized protein n=1 Tax=Chiloscyllium punctatum TaxID=137246 RepID=A0A401TSV3_CHIPU|nr:hypothetical protein [Chiloscyllium punctatum]